MRTTKANTAQKRKNKEVIILTFSFCSYVADSFLIVFLFR